MRTLLPLVLVLAVAGCESIVPLRRDYVPVPDAALREVALEVERAVQAGERQPTIADREGLAVNDPAILQAIRTRAARAELLNQFLDAGYGWERRNGLVDIRTGKDYKKQTTKRDRDRNALLVLGENTDRWSLYEGLVKASHFRPDARERIQQAFHEARVQAMREGQLYEDEAGNPVPKGAN